MRYKLDPKNWLQLQFLNNCFNDKSKKHLGLKFEGEWYCITHNPFNEKVLIPKEDLDMRDYSPKNEYLKRVYGSAPNIVNPTNMSISRAILEKYIYIHGNN